MQPDDGARPEIASNAQMEAMNAIERRLTDLEIKASFNEDLVEHLNLTIARQQQQIDRLLRDLAQLQQQQAPEGGSAGFRSLRDELPPHY